MDLNKLILTENACYKDGRPMIPTGIMVHSTGANNPNLKRYVGPDDGTLGVNKYNNHWNNDTVDACVHAFIGLDKDGNLKTYQTLPWNMRGWHAGGSANNNYIGFEICEDDLTDKAYFEKAYTEAVELCAHLCTLFSLDPLGKNVIICHADGYKLGIASNHADVYHWFKRYNKDMDDFRADVKKAMTPVKKEESSTEEMYRVRKTWKSPNSQIGAFKVLDNAKALVDKNPGYKVFNNAGEVVYPVVAKPTTKPTPKPTTNTKKSIDEVALAVIRGDYGVGADRKNKLQAEGYNYDEVQSKVNEILSGKKSESSLKSIDEVAREVIRGEWGNGNERKKRLTDAGYKYIEVQVAVNKLLGK